MLPKNSDSWKMANGHVNDSLITRKDRLSDRFTVAVKYRKYSLYDFLQGT